MYSVISVIVDSLPGNTKNWESTRSWTARVRLFHPWADLSPLRLFCLCVSFADMQGSFAEMGVRLFCRYTGLFCRYTGLFCGKGRVQSLSRFHSPSPLPPYLSHTTPPRCKGARQKGLFAVRTANSFRVPRSQSLPCCHAPPPASLVRSPLDISRAAQR